MCSLDRPSFTQHHRPEQWQRMAVVPLGMRMLLRVKPLWGFCLTADILGC